MAKLVKHSRGLSVRVERHPQQVLLRPRCCLCAHSCRHAPRAQQRRRALARPRAQTRRLKGSCPAPAGSKRVCSVHASVRAVPPSKAADPHQSTRRLLASVHACQHVDEWLVHASQQARRQECHLHEPQLQRSQKGKGVGGGGSGQQCAVRYGIPRQPHVRTNEAHMLSRTRTFTTGVE